MKSSSWFKRNEWKYLTQLRPMRGHISVKGGQAWIYANQVCRLLEWRYIPNLNEICLLVHAIMGGNQLTEFRRISDNISVKRSSSVTIGQTILRVRRMNLHNEYKLNTATVLVQGIWMEITWPYLDQWGAISQSNIGQAWP